MANNVPSDGWEVGQMEVAPFRMGARFGVMEHDELAQHLASLQRESRYRVDAVLKKSPVEITQRVYFRDGSGAETGPFVRKFIKRDMGMGAAYARLLEAQRSGARFAHLPEMLECYLRDDFLVVVMEHVGGRTLQEAVYQDDPSMGLALRVFPQLCDGVAELHEGFAPSIIHQDLKPSNIVLTDTGLMLIDLGISRECLPAVDGGVSRFGTKEFASPEQFGQGQATVRSDVYSLGLVLFYCLTEVIPRAAVRERGFADPRIPEAVRAVIARAASLDAEVRYANVHDLRESFLRACSSRLA